MPLALALALAITGSSALYAASLALAPFAAPLLVIVPLPGLLLSTRATAPIAGLWCVLTTAAVAVLLGPAAVPGFILLSGLPALVLATGLRRLWRLEFTMIGSLSMWCFGMLVLAWGGFHDIATVVAAVRAHLESSIDLALSTYGSMGASETAIALVQAERDALVDGLLQILPAIVILIGAFSLMFNLLLLRNWADAARHENLRLWRTPDALIWVLIASGFGIFIPSPAVAVLAKNVFLIVLACYFCQGLAIVSYYLDRFRLPRGIRVVGYVLIAVQYVIAALVLALGIFDLWGNFRRLSTGPANISLHPDGD